MESKLDEMAILRLPDVMRLIGLRRTTIYDMMAKGTFPRSVALSARAKGWRAGDIRAWLESREQGYHSSQSASLSR
ncbi:MAG: AlpA family phage regulatory protein [Pseudomonadota bacterium]